MKTTYQLSHVHDGRRVTSAVEFQNETNARQLAAALNKKFPTRFYRVEPVQQTERARILEFVN